MAVYRYEVKKPGGAVEHGQIQSSGVAQANKLLRDQGSIVLSLTEQPEEGKKPLLQLNFKQHKVPLKEKIIFSRQLSVMVKAGLSAVKALESLQKQTENKYFKTVLEDLMVTVRGGQVLSKAMDKHPKVFSDVYTAVVKAGEETGQLSDVLLNLAEQQEKEADLIGKVKGAMIYPAVIFFLLIAVLILIVVFVIPSLQKIFADSGVQLPLLTRFLLGTSNFIRAFYWLIIPIVIGLIYALRFYAQTTPGREIYDKLKIKLPIFGSLTKKVYIARFSRTMAMLIKASLPIIQSIQIIRKTISNVHYKRAFERIEREVESGKTFSSAIGRESLFPPMVAQLISLGEETGNMESVLLDVAGFYDKEVDTMSRNLATLLEPIMLIVMGVGVGFVIASVLGPIYGLVQAF